MKENEELKKCQEIIHNAIIGYLNILNKKALLEQSINQKYNNDLNLINSIRTIQETLYSSLLIDIHAWLFDTSRNNRKNLSLYQLLNKLKREDFIKSLGKDFSNPPNIIVLEGEENINFWKESIKEERLSKFDEKVKICIEKYEKFINSKTGNRIKNIRNKVFAHKERDYSIEAKGHRINEAMEAMEEMKIIVELLNELFRRTYYPIEEEEENTIKNAKIFWRHVFNK